MKALDGTKSKTLADGVESHLLEYIQNSGFQPGDLMPKEAELAQKLAVSRSIVRESISRLKMLGLVESRKRKGMIVSRPNAFAGVSKLAAAKLFSSEENRELMEIRIMMEMGMVDFIYARKTPEKVAALRKLAGKQSSVHSMECELAFHEALFAIGGNAMASQFRNVLASALKPVYAKLFPGTGKTPTHLEICDQLEHGGLEEFRETVKLHFKPYLL